ncbi:hypothetical protein RYX36_022550 [Vicia faba]
MMTKGNALDRGFNGMRFGIVCEAVIRKWWNEVVRGYYDGLAFCVNREERQEEMYDETGLCAAAGCDRFF